MHSGNACCMRSITDLPLSSDLKRSLYVFVEFVQKGEYTWFKDEVQTARISFYLRVIPTCIERLPSSLFSRVVAPTMFLYPEFNN